MAEVNALIVAAPNPRARLIMPEQWRAIRTLNDSIARPPEPIRKPRKREFLYVMVLTSDQGVLEDKKAERDGNWIVGHKHDMLVPYQEPTRVLEFRHSNRRPVPVGEMVVIDHDPGSEWETELWRQAVFWIRRFYVQGQAHLRSNFGGPISSHKSGFWFGV